jgi:hypothetical protein
MRTATARSSFRALGTLAALVVSSLSGACASQNQEVVRAPSAGHHTPEAAKSAPSPKTSEAAPGRRVGDFSVHMISGSFRKQPALLTERVTSEEYGRWVIEYRLEDTEGSATLRVWMNQDSGQVEKVSRIVDGAEKPATVADFDALMAAASVVPDTNEGLVANSSGTCTLGPAELDCETKSYKVRLGDREASLGVTRSDALPGTDLSGEITAADGSVIYRSELIERGNESETANDSFALR